MPAVRRIVVGLLFVLSLIASPDVARAQGGGQAGEARTFGATSLVSHTLQAYAFVGLKASDSAAFADGGLGSRSCTNTSCTFNAAVLLPAGALLTRIELDACDTSSTASVRSSLSRIGALESSFQPLVLTVPTGGLETPGCALSGQDLDPPHVIDNVSNTYLAQVFISGTTTLSASTRFQALRIFYRLQVSPAPATARFDDVPTDHAFFQFIEALAAAGITTGCSATPPLYCPDNPVTRGQMAVFISKALGLHWAP